MRVSPFLLVHAGILSCNAQGLFLRTKGKTPNLIPQCASLQIEFGGGTPPYNLEVRAGVSQKSAAQFRTDVSGLAAWSLQHNPLDSPFNLYLTDNRQKSANLGPFIVFLSLPPDTSCFSSSVPRFRMIFDENTISGSSSGDYPPTLLEDCRRGGQASCTFTSEGSVGTYHQQALIGNPFSNCNSTKSVKQTIGGSTTITDSWSITGSGSMGLSGTYLSVSGTVGQSKAVTLSQTIEYEIGPGQQSALVGLAEFEAYNGSMTMEYPNKTILNVPDIVHLEFTGNPPVFQRMDLDCDQTWPRWNATTQPLMSSAIITYHYHARGLGVLALIIMIFAVN